MHKTDIYIYTHTQTYIYTVIFRFVERERERERERSRRGAEATFPRLACSRSNLHTSYSPAPSTRHLFWVSGLRDYGVVFRVRVQGLVLWL